MNTMKPPDRRIRRLLAIGLVIFSPVCGEYISGYDDNTGEPLRWSAGC